MVAPNRMTLWDGPMRCEDSMTNKFYQRRTMQRIPRTAGEAERFLWHVLEHLADNIGTNLPGSVQALPFEIVNNAIHELQIEQGIR